MRDEDLDVNEEPKNATEADAAPSAESDHGAMGGPATEEVEGSSSNPLGEHLDFNLSVPTIEVRMVNAGALEDYELWFLFSSLISSAAIGFLVAYLQSAHRDSQGVEHYDSTYLVVSVIFFGLLIFCLWRALTLRKRITSESKTYQMRASASKLVEQSEKSANL